MLTKLGICIDITEIWFGIANGQISSILTELSARNKIIAEYYRLFFFFFFFFFFVNYLLLVSPFGGRLAS